jgi:hypothetical protein
MRDHCLNMRHVQLKPSQGLLRVGNATATIKPQALYRSPTDAQSGISTCKEYPGLLTKPLCHILLHIIVWHEHMALEGSLASHKSNPLSVPQGYVDMYSILPWVMWEAVTGVAGIPCWGYYETCWLTGLWSTKAKVEGNVLKAARHWGNDGSVVTIPLENQAHPTVCRLSIRVWLRGWWVYVFSHFVGWLLNWGLRQI